MMGLFGGRFRAYYPVLHGICFIRICRFPPQIDPVPYAGHAPVGSAGKGVGPLFGRIGFISAYGDLLADRGALGSTLSA